EIELVVGVAVGAGGVDQVFAEGMPVGSPVDVGVVGQLVLLGCAGDLAGGIEGEISHEDLEQVVGVAIGAINQALAVRGEKWAAVVAGGGGDADGGFVVGTGGLVTVYLSGYSGGLADIFSICLWLECAYIVE